MRLKFFFLSVVSFLSIKAVVIIIATTTAINPQQTPILIQPSVVIAAIIGIVIIIFGIISFHIFNIYIIIGK